MNPETVSTITTWLGLITLTFAAIGSIIVIAIAVVQSLKSRVVRWDALIFAVVLLWSLPYGIRVYGPELVDATIDLLNNLAGKREPMEEAIKAFIGDAGEAVLTVPVMVDTGQPTIIITSTPFPDYAATATALVPTPTPFVMIEPTWTDYQWQTNGTPAPTVFICQSIEDVAKGCTPPIPVPGG